MVITSSLDIVDCSCVPSPPGGKRKFVWQKQGQEHWQILLDWFITKKNPACVVSHKSLNEPLMRG